MVMVTAIITDPGTEIKVNNKNLLDTISFLLISDHFRFFEERKIQTYACRRVVDLRLIFGIGAEFSGDDYLHGGDSVNAGCIGREEVQIVAGQSRRKWNLNKRKS